MVDSRCAKSGSVLPDPLSFWPNRQVLRFWRWIGSPVLTSMFVERPPLRTVLKRRMLRAPRMASAPGSSSAFSTSVTALMSFMLLDSWVASDTLSAAFASCRRITPPQMTFVSICEG
jgi:hypothetical protein